MKRLRLLSALAVAFFFSFVPCLVKADLIGGTSGNDLTAWVAFTPAASGRWVDSNHTDTGFWRKVGGNMEIIIKTSVTGAVTNANYQVFIPTGYTIDLTKLVNSSNPEILGMAQVRSSGNQVPGYVIFDGINGTNNALAVQTNNGSSPPVMVPVTGTFPATFANGDWVTFHASVPIIGW
jgi:hypothetical protein